MIKAITPVHPKFTQGVKVNQLSLRKDLIMLLLRLRPNCENNEFISQNEIKVSIGSNKPTLLPVINISPPPEKLMQMSQDIFVFVLLHWLCIMGFYESSRDFPGMMMHAKWILHVEHKTQILSKAMTGFPGTKIFLCCACKSFVLSIVMRWNFESYLVFSTYLIQSGVF